MTNTLNRVASGSRINRAADDAAGSAVSVNLSVTANSTLAANRNARDGQSMLHVSEAALNEASSLIVRVRELAVQSASDTLEDSERLYIQEEFTEILAEIKRISLTSEFNDQLVGTGEAYEVQVGTEDSDNDRISLTMGDVKSAYTGLSVISLEDSTSARISLGRIDTGMDRLNKEQARVGSLHNRLNNAIANNVSKHDSLMSAASRIQDADMAFETSQMTATQIKLQAGAAAMSQAKQLPASVIQLI